MQLGREFAQVGIGVVPIPVTETVFVPTVKNRQGQILSVIRNAPSLEESFCWGGEFHIREIPSTRKHTLNGHMVEWIVENHKNGKVLAWDRGVHSKLSKDSKFLTGVERYFKSIHEKQPDRRIYMVMGFKPADLKVPDHYLPGSFASQYPPHIHVTEPCDNTEHESVLEWGNENDRRVLVRFYDLAQVMGLEYFSSLIGNGNFGREFKFNQTVGLPGIYQTVYPRTMFAFRSFPEAFAGIIDLTEKIEESNTWDKYARTIFEDGLGINGDGVSIPIRTFSVPSFAIIFPSDNDRRNGKVDNLYPVWVQPFSVCGPPAELAKGGAYYPPKWQNGQVK